MNTATINYRKLIITPILAIMVSLSLPIKTQAMNADEDLAREEHAPSMMRELIKTDQYEKFKQQLEAIADINYKDRQSGQALVHTAAFYANFNILQLLIARGACVNLKGDIIGRTPLYYVCMRAKHAEHVPDNCLKCVELLLENGADIDAYADGASPLHWACSANHLPIIKLLLSKNADINCKDERDEETPEQWAHTEAAQLIQEEATRRNEIR